MPELCEVGQYGAALQRSHFHAPVSSCAAVAVYETHTVHVQRIRLAASAQLRGMSLSTSPGLSVANTGRSAFVSTLTRTRAGLGAETPKAGAGNLPAVVVQPAPAEKGHLKSQ